MGQEEQENKRPMYRAWGRDRRDGAGDLEPGGW